MGEAKRKREQQDTWVLALQEPVAQAASALQRMCAATSERFGHDCYVHTLLAQRLLSDLGVEGQLHCGYAAWRVGGREGDVLAHLPEDTVTEVVPVPEGTQGFMYHAWLNVRDLIIDVTTYQIPRKVRMLDEQFGSHTDIRWAPDYVIVRPTQISSIEQLANGSKPGALYYKRIEPFETFLVQHCSLDPEDLHMARFLMRHPETIVKGIFSEHNT